jgi:hypothetical protein
MDERRGESGVESKSCGRESGEKEGTEKTSVSFAYTVVHKSTVVIQQRTHAGITSLQEISIRDEAGGEREGGTRPSNELRHVVCREHKRRKEQSQCWEDDLVLLLGLWQ